MQYKIKDYPDITEWWGKCAKVNIRTFCVGVYDHMARLRRNTKKYLFACLSVVLCEGKWKEVAIKKWTLAGARNFVPAGHPCWVELGALTWHWPFGQVAKLDQPGSRPHGASAVLQDPGVHGWWHGYKSPWPSSRFLSWTSQTLELLSGLLHRWTTPPSTLQEPSRT